MCRRVSVSGRESVNVGQYRRLSASMYVSASIKMWAVVCVYQDVDSCWPALKAFCVSAYLSTFQKPDMQLQVSVHIICSAYELA